MENWVISRRSTYGIVEFENDKEDDEKISYCKNCLEYGFMVPLRNRVYPDNENIPVDHDQWRQCLECGLIVPIYELQKETEIKDVVETIDNPFDVGTSFLGIDNRTSVGATNARKKRERQKALHSINDKDVKRELAKGHTLLSYSEQMPQ